MSNIVLSEALRLREMVKTGEKATELGGFREVVEPSDKLGQDWIVTYLGDVIVKKEYVEAEPSEADGTADHPYIFAEGVLLKPNAYYMYNDIRYVYVSPTSKVATTWEDCEADMEAF